MEFASENWGYWSDYRIYGIYYFGLPGGRREEDPRAAWERLVFFLWVSKTEPNFCALSGGQI